MKKGGPTHGILTFLSQRGAQGARAHEIYTAFPRTVGSSILTTMRRGGLIAKAGAKLTTPWLITPLGAELLAKAPAYTPTSYWTNVFYRDIDSVEKTIIEHPEYYGKKTTVKLFGWEQPDFMERERNFRCYGPVFRSGCVRSRRLVRRLLMEGTP